MLSTLGSTNLKYKSSVSFETVPEGWWGKMRGRRSVELRLQIVRTREKLHTHFQCRQRISRLAQRYRGLRIPKLRQGNRSPTRSIGSKCLLDDTFPNFCT